MAVFGKPPLDIDQQLALFKQRGLIVTDESDCKKILQNISFFRLRAYAQSFRDLNTGDFKERTTFEMIYRLYEFDNRLRSLVFEALIPVEVSFRTQMVNELAVKYGAHWYLDSQNFNDRYYHSSFIEKIRQTVKEQENQEHFIKKYLSDYTDPALPPSWMLWEILSLGTLSKTFSALHGTDKTMISTHFNVHDRFVESWFQAFSYVRNLCAHHSRLWNRSLVIQPAIPTRKKNVFLHTQEIIDIKKIYFMMCCIQKIALEINSPLLLREPLRQLLSNYPEIDLSKMGFTTDWEKEPIWQ